MKARLLSALVISVFAAAPALAADAVSGATQASKAAASVPPEKIDALTSASVVPKALRQSATPNGFTKGAAKKVLFIVGDPRHESVEWDLVNTAASHFMEQGLEVEIRDLYRIGFNPVLPAATFHHAKDGWGQAPADVAREQPFVSAADIIVFAYPNWHDSPNAITKGYMERVFSKQFAYRDTANGLEGMLKGKKIYTIMNAGWIGQGRGDVGDGIGKSDAVWDKYLGAYKVVDDDTAAFWGATNAGRFANDQTPGNLDKDYGAKLEALRADLCRHLDKAFGLGGK